MINILSCSKELKSIVMFLQNGVVPIIQIGIPIILIVLGMIDLGKGVVASKKEEVNAAFLMFFKRILSAIIIYFMVHIVILIFDTYAETTNDKSGTNWQDCWEIK